MFTAFLGVQLGSFKILSAQENSDGCRIETFLEEGDLSVERVTREIYRVDQIGTETTQRAYWPIWIFALAAGYLVYQNFFSTEEEFEQQMQQFDDGKPERQTIRCNQGAIRCRKQ